MDFTNGMSSKKLVVGLGEFGNWRGRKGTETGCRGGVGGRRTAAGCALCLCEAAGRILRKGEDRGFSMASSMGVLSTGMSSTTCCLPRLLFLLGLARTRF